MSQGRADDPEVSAAMAEYLLISELRLDPEMIDRLSSTRFALYVAQAELAGEERAAAARRMK